MFILCFLVEDDLDKREQDGAGDWNFGTADITGVWIPVAMIYLVSLKFPEGANVSAKQDDQLKYLSDIGMFHKLGDAKKLLLEKHVESAFLLTHQLRPEDFPQQFREEFMWLQTNYSTEVGRDNDGDSGSAEKYSSRTAQFLNAVLRWRKENQ